MPGHVYERAARYWDNALTCDLNKLTSSPPQGEPPGCEPTGSISAFNKLPFELYFFTRLTPAFDIGPRKKQPDGGVCPTGFDYPSVVLEVGSSESLSQLHIDAQLWIEHTNYVRFRSLFFFPPRLSSTGEPCCPYMYRPTSSPEHHSSNHLPTMATCPLRSPSTLQLRCTAEGCSSCPK